MALSEELLCKLATSSARNCWFAHGDCGGYLCVSTAGSFCARQSREAVLQCSHISLGRQLHQLPDLLSRHGLAPNSLKPLPAATTLKIPIQLLPWHFIRRNHCAVELSRTSTGLHQNLENGRAFKSVSYRVLPLKLVQSALFSPLTHVEPACLVRKSGYFGDVVPMRRWTQARQELVQECHLVSALINSRRHVKRRDIRRVLGCLLGNWVVVSGEQHLGRLNCWVVMRNLASTHASKGAHIGTVSTSRSRTGNAQAPEGQAKQKAVQTCSERSQDSSPRHRTTHVALQLLQNSRCNGGAVEGRSPTPQLILHCKRLSLRTVERLACDVLINCPLHDPEPPASAACRAAGELQSPGGKYIPPATLQDAGFVKSCRPVLQLRQQPAKQLSNTPVSVCFSINNAAGQRALAL